MLGRQIMDIASPARDRGDDAKRDVMATNTETLCVRVASHYHNPATGENVAVLSRAECTPSLGHLHLPLAAAADPTLFDCARVWYDIADAEAGAAGRCGFAAR